MRRSASPQRVHRLGFAALIIAVLFSVIYFSNSRRDVQKPVSNSAPAPQKIAASQSILIVVDVQRDFWIPEVSGSRPDFTANLESLLAVCRASDVPILHVRTAFDPSQKNFPAAFQKTHDELRLCDPGTRGFEPLPCAVALQQEPVFEKGNFDPFSLDRFRAAVADSGAKNVYICGLYTDVCVLSTALSAFNSGYRVTLIEDCCASTPATHEFVIQRFRNFIFDTLGHEEFARRIVRRSS